MMSQLVQHKHGNLRRATTRRRRTSIQQKGIIILDLMIGATIGLIVVAAAIKIYIVNINANTESLKSSKLNQQVNAILQIITRDVRRAGYWSIYPDVNTLKDNPFNVGFNNISVSQKNLEAANSCLLYSYDLNKDASIGVSNGAAPGAPFNAAPYNQANVEQFGFRRNGNDLEMRQGLAPGDIDVTCDNGTWVRVNSNLINITDFSLTLNTYCYNLDPVDHAPNSCITGRPGQEIRSLEIRLSAAYANDPTKVKSVYSFVKIANDRFVASYP